jgi:hypothetical protein
MVKQERLEQMVPRAQQEYKATQVPQAKKAPEVSKVLMVSRENRV